MKAACWLIGSLSTPPRCSLSSAVAGSNSLPTTSSSISSLPYPRAAVASVLAHRTAEGKPHRYLLVKRGNPPGKGKWSLPGGKLELGESTLAGAAREVEEETSLPPHALTFHPRPITSTDAIVYADAADATDAPDVDNGDSDNEGGLSSPPPPPLSSSVLPPPPPSPSLQFHYCIAQCFAWVADEFVGAAAARDDVVDAAWFTCDEVRQMAGPGSAMVGVIDTARDLEAAGLLVEPAAGGTAGDSGGGGGTRGSGPSAQQKR